MRQLLTIFNRNDPTPTASSILSANVDEAIVLVIGIDSSDEFGMKNLKRMITWTSGSARKKDFPSQLWSSKLDWQSLEDRGIIVHIHNISSIGEFDFSTLSNDVIVDLVSGSKEQGALLIREYQEHCDTATFVVGQLNGTSINIASGEIIEPRFRLSIKERIWLSEGYVVWTARSGSNEIGEVVKDWPHEIVITSNGKKIVPMKQEGLKDLLQLEGSDLEGGFWLEYFSADVISTWPIVVESYASVGIIDPEFVSFCAVSMNTMTHKNKDPEQDFSFSSLGLEAGINKKQFSEWVISAQLEEEKKEIIWRNAHIMDIDFIGLIENGFVIIGECKDRPKRQMKPGFQQRVYSISKKLFPTSSLPLMVHSSPQKQKAGVFMTSWKDLKDSEKVLTEVNNSLNMFVKEKKNASLVKICSACGIHKPLNGWTKETFEDKDSTICNRCLKKQKKKKRITNAQMMEMLENIVKRIEVIEAFQLSLAEEE